MKFVYELRSKSILAASVFFLTLSEIHAQVTPVLPEQPEPEPTDDFTWWYVLLFLLFIGLAAAVFWWLNSRKTEQEAAARAVKAEKAQKLARAEPLDFDKELEWLRKNQKLVDRNQKIRKKPKRANKQNLQMSKAQTANSDSEKTQQNEIAPERLPIFSINRLEFARPFNPLAISRDESLLSAIEQVYEEFEEDENVRELAVKILAMFKTRNSVEALSQVALYDISSNLRSKAVGILAEFDHESVFETILLACADPTREVRAAAARGLFRLSFDRADAWARVAESNDEFKMRQAARAAIEGDLVVRSFERLVHPDRRYAYEAFVLVALLLKSGETEIVFDTLKKQQNENVCKAILHVFKIVKEPAALEQLIELSESIALPESLKEQVNETISQMDLAEV